MCHLSTVTVSTIEQKLELVWIQSIQDSSAEWIFADMQHLDPALQV